jgi:alkylation response protein AidB-like acyl-CoA dehydrogenase
MTSGTLHPASLGDRLDTLRRHADRFDAAGHFPSEALDMLRDGGLLAAPVPVRLGGVGMGTSPEGAGALAVTLRRLGAAWLPLARVFEGHVNAIRLIMRYGTPEQAGRAAADAPSHLFAIWAAEARPVLLREGRLSGTKSFASAAGVVTRPLVTARHEGREQLVLLSLLGMRGAGTAAVDLEGLAVGPDDLIGGPDDYMRQPEISLGSWRALPGLLGAMQALTDLVAAHLRERRRDTDPIQLGRLGRMLAAAETASLWVDRVSVVAEADGAGEPAAAEVKLARHAVDEACGLILDHARRAVGLAAFARPSPIERLCRDLDTYRRQPALDEALLEAARHHLGTVRCGETV